ncbi:MAG: hypothetical protein MZV64_18995 [Ignavibacteriales bacterium]|nr:hypothetical protein [Ignavibacteriales bacterium]
MRKKILSLLSGQIVRYGPRVQRVDPRHSGGIGARGVEVTRGPSRGGEDGEGGGEHVQTDGDAVRDAAAGSVCARGSIRV